MGKTRRRRGQSLTERFSRASIEASEGSREHIKENLVDRFPHISGIKLLILEWGLLVLALIMLASTQAFWFADSYSEDAFVEGGTYTEATIGEVDSLNPLFATTNSEKTLSRLLFATIVTDDYSGHLGMGLAQSVEPDESGKTWTVKLRDGLKWSDGEPITNADVVFTAELIKNPVVKTSYDSNLSNVKITDDGEGGIVFELPSAYADFDSALNIPIVPKHILENTDPKTLVENSFSSAPITSGAFTFNAVQAGATSSENVYYLSANNYYYLGKPLLSSFAVHTYKDKLSVAEALNSGVATATAELSGPETSSVTSGHFNIKESSLNVGAFIFFNTLSETTKDVELRTAIREGIDIQQIRSVAEGTQPLDWPLLSSQIELENYPTLPTQDREAAKAKISELAGDNMIRMRLVTVNSGYLPAIGDMVAEELKELGIEVELLKYDETQDFVSNVIARRDYDMLIYEVELGVRPDLLPYYHSSQVSTTGLNLANYRNTFTDDLLLGARDTMNVDLRIKKYEMFLGYWANDIPAIGLYQPNLTYVYNRNVRTYNDSVRTVNALDRFIDVENWAVNKTTKNKTP